jgi:hypothetical protein
MSLPMFRISSGSRVGSTQAVNKIQKKKTSIAKQIVISQDLDLEYSALVRIYYLSRQREQHV